MSFLCRIGLGLLGLPGAVALGWGAEAAESETKKPEDTEAAVIAEEEDWKINVDRFLENYLPRIDVQGRDSGMDDDWIVELPDFGVEADFDDARAKKAMPDRWDLLSDNAKKRIIAQERLTSLETKVLNRWILWWGVRPEDYVLAIEERERARAYKVRNTQLLRQLEEIRPGILRGKSD